MKFFHEKDIFSRFVYLYKQIHKQLTILNVTKHSLNPHSSDRKKEVIKCIIWYSKNLKIDVLIGGRYIDGYASKS